MTKTLSEMIAVMQAAERGEEIEWSTRGVADWSLARNPFWDWKTYNYRVKPKPREWWINVYVQDGCRCHSTRIAADISATRDRVECVRVREVIE